MKGYEVGNSLLIRDLNLTSIFRLIYKYGPVSRKELAENTGYSAGTISNHVKRLLEEGYVIETEKGHSTGGRKPVYLTVNPESGYIIAINIKVNRVDIHLFDLKLSLIIKTGFSNGGKAPEEVLNRVRKQINEILKEKGIVERRFLGIGIAVPGLIEKDLGLLDFAPNLGWKRVDIIQPFIEEYSRPVILENEANAAATGEREFVYPETGNMVFVSINEGIGCGIIFEGKLYRGSSGNAGEFGHIIIESNGPKCHCGNRGCWETMASESYLLDQGRRIKNKELTLGKIYSLAKKGDPEILEVFHEIANNIGLGLTNIINSLNPELLVIGGGCVRGREFMEKDIKGVLERETLEISYKKTRIQFSKMGDEVVARGLAIMVLDEVIEKGMLNMKVKR